MLKIRTATNSDWEWILKESEPIGGVQVVSLGVLHSLEDYEAIVAVEGGERKGFAVYRVVLPGVELLALRAVEQWTGIGTGLLRELEERVKQLEAKSIFLCTTNDNLSALRFYQRRGYHLKALNAGQFREVLALKGLDPGSKVIGLDGIAIRDEIVLEKTEL